jgi:hypothetical protein
MRRSGGHVYSLSIPDGEFEPGLFEYVVTLDGADGAATFPGPAAGKPGVWPFAPAGVWTFRIAPPETPISLFEPRRDYDLLSFVRPEERYRATFFRIAPGETSDEPSLHLAVPDLGADTPPLYAAALYVGDVIMARVYDARRKHVLAVRFRASGGARKTLELLLIERDGSSWRGAFTAERNWTTARVSLDSLEFSRSIHIPSPFPGLWNYWRQGPPARATTHIRPGAVERLELRVRGAAETQDDAPGVEIASVWLE